MEEGRLSEEKGIKRRLEKRLSDNTDGMITIEVSVIIPFLFFLTAGIIFFQFFMIDMAAAKSESMKAGTEAAASWKTGGSPADKSCRISDLLGRAPDYLISGEAESTVSGKVSERFRERMAERQIVVKRSSLEINTSEGIVHVREHISFPIPLRSIGIGGWTFVCCQAAAVDNLQECLRKECAKSFGQ